MRNQQEGTGLAGLGRRGSEVRGGAWKGWMGQEPRESIVLDRKGMAWQEIA